MNPSGESKNFVNLVKLCILLLQINTTEIKFIVDKNNLQSTGNIARLCLVHNYSRY